ncbi:uncharacterized protein LOC143686895 [Tamandua tetradactyla]|uniref:uncharacterized protein LOC143686895 n=1 Tax=Tamandua tetradactyla TaxID=48850 RepID=UPI004053B151
MFNSLPSLPDCPINVAGISDSLKSPWYFNSRELFLFPFLSHLLVCEFTEGRHCIHVLLATQNLANCLLKGIIMISSLISLITMSCIKDEDRMEITTQAHPVGARLHIVQTLKNWPSSFMAGASVNEFSKWI